MVVASEPLTFALTAGAAVIASVFDAFAAVMIAAQIVLGRTVAVAGLVACGL